MGETQPSDSETQTSSNTRKWILPGLIALGAAATCVALAVLALALGMRPSRQPTQPAATVPNSPRAATEPTDSPLPAETSAVLSQLAPETLAQMEEIEDQVVTLRGLQPSAPVERRLITTEELAEIVREDLLEEYSREEAHDDALLLAYLGLIEPGFDLWSFYTDLYSEQVAGFFDDEDSAMYIVQGQNFGGPERLTYAHEYVHALQDQNYDLAEGLGFQEELCEQDSERCKAVQSLVEGDATLLEAQWLRTYATDQERAEISAFYQSFESPVFRRAPTYIQDTFVFPYEAGLQFVAWVFRNGGWAAVDSTYAEPPSSTEQIIEPARYPDDAPVRLEPPDLGPGVLGRGWRSLDEGTLGHLDLRLLLAQQLDSADAQRAADGWGGDVYLVFHHDESGRNAGAFVQVWDTVRDAQEAYLVWRDYGEARIGPGTATGQAYEWESDRVFARLERGSIQTLWIMAPDRQTGEALREALTFPLPEQ